MIVTKEEAKKKACPMVEREMLCINIGCMAWREVDGKHGYCGMAGLPHRLVIEVMQDDYKGVLPESEEGHDW